MTSPEIPDSASPYWLRMYGKWMPLQGIMPVNDVKSDRQFSELMTVDGYRYEQAAPRGPRTWELPYRWATAAATAALEAAAYAVPIGTQSTGDIPLLRTLFLDTNAAKANMLEPDIPRVYDDTRPVIKAGGVWLPSYDNTEADPNFVLVRAGVTYTAAVWTTAPSGSVLSLYEPGSGVPAVFVDATGGGTAENPELVSYTWTPDSDGEWYVVGAAPTNPSSASTAGLMFFEGDCPPEFYRHGQRMPCQVSVRDPGLTVNPIWSKRCDPCALPRQHAQFVVQEVGPAPVVGEVS